MSSTRMLQDIADISALAERLSRCESVRRLDENGEEEAWTLAHAFSDLEQSFQTVLQDHLPRLTQDSLEPEEASDLLLDIGEELRHILYHVHDPKFYRYLRTES